MASELATAASVGFRHVVEDGLSLLREQRLPAARQEYVLSKLVRLLSDAARGQEIMAEQALFVGAKEREASESYSLLDRYLQNEDWTTRLAVSRDALRRLKEGAAAEWGEIRRYQTARGASDEHREGRPDRAAVCS